MSVRMLVMTTANKLCLFLIDDSNAEEEFDVLSGATHGVGIARTKRRSHSAQFKVDFFNPYNAELIYRSGSVFIL